MVYIVPLVRGTSTSNDGATVDSFQAVSGSTRERLLAMASMTMAMVAVAKWVGGWKIQDATPV